MERHAAGRPTRSWTFDANTRDGEPPTSLWRVPVNVELVLEAEDQEAAISKAEDLFRHVIPARPLPRNTKVEVVMSLPIQVGCE
jgi:hypothetical protein